MTITMQLMKQSSIMKQRCRFVLETTSVRGRCHLSLSPSEHRASCWATGKDLLAWTQKTKNKMTHQGCITSRWRVASCKPVRALGGRQPHPEASSCTLESTAAPWEAELHESRVFSFENFRDTHRAMKVIA